MRSGEAGEGSELAEFGARWPPPYAQAQGYGWTRSATPQHPPAHHLARHSRSQQVIFIYFIIVIYLYRIYTKQSSRVTNFSLCSSRRAN